MTPHPAWMKRRFSASRPWENTDCAPFSEVPDLTRGEQRLAAEVALTMADGAMPPEAAVKRALATLTKLAFA